MKYLLQSNLNAVQFKFLSYYYFFFNFRATLPLATNANDLIPNESLYSQSSSNNANNLINDNSILTTSYTSDENGEAYYNNGEPVRICF